MVKNCMKCGADLDNNICPDCGYDNSSLYDNDVLRILIIFWSISTAISTILIFPTVDYDRCLAATAAIYCSIMLAGTVLQYITKFIYFTNIANFIAMIAIFVPIGFTEPTGGGWGGLFIFGYIIVPTIIVSLIGNIISLIRKEKAQ